MNRRVLLCLMLGALSAGSCGSDPAVGLRYRAEREMWQLEWKYRNMNVRPEETTESAWLALADEFERVGAQYRLDPEAARRSGAAKVARAIAARAWFASGQIHGALGDSTRMTATFEGIAAEFVDLPETAAEVALARAGIAEAQGDLARALDEYALVVRNVAPKAGGAPIEEVVLSLPLRIARLRTRMEPQTDPGSVYAPAREYYGRLVREHAGDLLRTESRRRLIEIAGDLRDWREQLRQFRNLEEELRAEPEWGDPAQARLAAATAYLRLDAAGDSSRALLLSLTSDYPESKAAPVALVSLAEEAGGRHQVGEALTYLDRVARDYPENEDAMTMALSSRAGILQANGRWPDALEAYRVLMVEHPVSEAALWAPYRIFEHYQDAGDDAAAHAALADAERRYRDFLSRYPPGPASIFARRRLAQTLIAARKYDEAVTEMEGLAADVAGSPEGAAFLISAAQIAFSDLSDTSRAVGILDRLAEQYPKSRAGSWATSEAVRLRAARPN